MEKKYFIQGFRFLQALGVTGMAVTDLVIGFKQNKINGYSHYEWGAVLSLDICVFVRFMFSKETSAGSVAELAGQKEALVILAATRDSRQLKMPRPNDTTVNQYSLLLSKKLKRASKHQKWESVFGDLAKISLAAAIQARDWAGSKDKPSMNDVIISSVLLGVIGLSETGINAILPTQADLEQLRLNGLENTLKAFSLSEQIAEGRFVDQSVAAVTTAQNAATRAEIAAQSARTSEIVARLAARVADQSTNATDPAKKAAGEATTAAGEATTAAGEATTAAGKATTAADKATAQNAAGEATAAADEVTAAAKEATTFAKEATTAAGKATAAAEEAQQ